MRQFGLNDMLYMLSATQWTIYLSLVALVVGGLFGLAMCLFRLSANPVAQMASSAVVSVGLGVPPLIQLFLAYFGLAVAGYEVSPFIAASVSLSFFTAVYLGEIWRSAVETIPRPQWEAGEALALGWGQQLAYVIAPQAIRIAIPPTVGFFVQLIKNTSLASIVGLIELTRAGQLVNNATFQSMKVYLCVCAIYFLLCFPISLLSRHLERRLTVPA